MPTPLRAALRQVHLGGKWDLDSLDDGPPSYDPVPRRRHERGPDRLYGPSAIADPDGRTDRDADWRALAINAHADDI